MEDGFLNYGHIRDDMEEFHVIHKAIDGSKAHAGMLIVLSCYHQSQMPRTSSATRIKPPPPVQVISEAGLLTLWCWYSSLSCNKKVDTDGMLCTSPCPGSFYGWLADFVVLVVSVSCLKKVQVRRFWYDISDVTP